MTRTFKIDRSVEVIKPGETILKGDKGFIRTQNVSAGIGFSFEEKGSVAIYIGNDGTIQRFHAVDIDEFINLLTALKEAL